MNLETAKTQPPKLGTWMLWACNGKAKNSVTGLRHNGTFLRVFVVELGSFNYRVKSDIGFHNANARHLYWPRALYHWLAEEFARDIFESGFVVPAPSRPEPLKAQQ